MDGQDRRLARVRRRLVALTIFQAVASILVLGAWLSIDPGRRPWLAWVAVAIFILILNVVSLVIWWRRAPRMAEPTLPLSLDRLGDT